MEKAAGEGAPARTIERRQPEREEHGEGYERRKRGRLPPSALREPQRQMPQAPNSPGGKTGRENRNSSLKLRLQDRSPTQFLVTAAHHEGSKEGPHGGDWAEAFREAIGGGGEKNQRHDEERRGPRERASQSAEREREAALQGKASRDQREPGDGGPKTPAVWSAVPMGLEYSMMPAEVRAAFSHHAGQVMRKVVRRNLVLARNPE